MSLSVNILYKIFIDIISFFRVNVTCRCNNNKGPLCTSFLFRPSSFLSRLISFPPVFLSTRFSLLSPLFFLTVSLFFLFLSFSMSFSQLLPSSLFPFFSFTLFFFTLFFFILFFFPFLPLVLVFFFTQLPLFSSSHSPKPYLFFYACPSVLRSRRVAQAGIKEWYPSKKWLFIRCWLV